MKRANIFKKKDKAIFSPAETLKEGEMRDYTTEGTKRFLRANGTAIRAFLVAVFLCAFVGGCKTIQYLPINTDTQVHYVDSVRYEIRDSVRITEATRYRDMAWLGDSLKIEGQRSRMWAVADTAKGAIVGGLEEDPQEEKQRIIYRDRWKTKDSLVYVEKPVPVEVIKEKKYTPWYMKALSLIGLLSILGTALWVFWKIKGFSFLKK